MAAVKIHLRNVDKSYELEPTDKKTSEGKTVYRNKKTGELHSELSVTLEYPEGSGNWINVPSLLNGRVYNAKGVLAMLKAGKLTPTSTHISEFDAIEAAKFRSNNLQEPTADEPTVTIIDKYGTYVTGTIQKYEHGKIIVNSKKGKVAGIINIEGGTTQLDVKDILLIDYGIKSVYSESDSTTKADLLNLISKILPESN